MRKMIQNSTETHLRNARISWAKGDLSAAKENFDRAFESEQPGNHLLAEYSLLLYRSQNKDQSWNTSWKSSTKGPLYWNELGVNQMDCGNTQEAVKAFQTAACLAPENERILGNLAMSMVSRETGEETREQLEWIVEQFPNQVRAHYVLGMLSPKTARVPSEKLLKKGQKLTLSRRTHLLSNAMPQEWEANVLHVTADEVTVSLTNGTRGFTPLRPGAKVILGFAGSIEFWGNLTDVREIKEETGTIVTLRNPGSFLRIQRRNHVRIEADHMIRQILLSNDLSDGESFRNIDISAGGVGFETDRNVTLGSKIGIDLTINEGVKRVHGTVVRNRRQGKNRFQIGVAFSDVAGEIHEEIAQNIHKAQLETPKRKPQATTGDSQIEIDGYQVLERVGIGAMGAVFRAVQLSVNRVVALKVLPPKNARNERIRQRFIQESKVLASLNHPNIISGIDAGETNGIHHFSMEYFAGTSIGKKLSTTGAMDVNTACSVVTEVAKALRHASSKRIIHRDIKPDNILMDEEGNVKLCDFGISKNDRETNTWKTNPGTKMGTPHYISPEQ
ncbi:MAG: protein kinase, partial [Planctomycetota bacterium]|nr:protein kinase [Planctomycetota bacterium]